MRNASSFLAVTLLAASLAAAACTPQQGATPTPTATSPSGPSGSPAPTATATPRSPAGPQTSPTPTVNITVSSPTGGTTISNPVKITGKARVFEAALMVAVRDGSGKLLGEMPVMASAGGPAWGNYTADLQWDAAAATTTNATVEAFTHSARDGSVIDLIKVNVTLPARAGATPAAARTPSPGPTRTP